MAKTNFESLRVYQLSEQLADQVWSIVLDWNSFARDTIGKQRRAYKRNLLEQKETSSLKTIVDELAPKLNAYLKSIGKVPVAEPSN